MSAPPLIEAASGWLKGTGPMSRIVISSRVRLARNLRGHPFPGWSKKNERLAVLHRARSAIESLPAFEGACCELLEALSQLDKQILVEKHIISREHAAKSVGSAIVLDPARSLCIMINEEDHLRMQAVGCGLRLEEVHAAAAAADSALESLLDFAFHPRLGYLTACPTNVGTGMRASAMLHLPALVMGDHISKIINSVNKIGLAVRGLHGEGTEAMGNLFQVSNQTTLGESEAEILARLRRVIEQIIEHEENARQILLQHKPVTLLDQVGRAYGILSHAHSISSKEALNLLSILKLAADLGMLPPAAREAADNLFVETQPAHLQKGAGTQKMSAEERDTLRAALIRATLRQIPGPAAAGHQPGARPQPNPADDE
ncbi:MAG: protein arginine kinase [Terrimicrobiaceae bacterium]|nr:protein arginine kinase [Terrimicrobiaceae bacterium]